MATRICVGCGVTNQPFSSYCSFCRTEFRKPIAQGTQEAATDLRLSLGRVCVVSLLSAGLYLFYWVYLTWKQLEAVSRERPHYPVWHALTLIIPIYSLFRMHKHMSVIRDLADESRVFHSLSPGVAVLLFVIVGVVDSVLWDVTDVAAALALGFVGAVLTAGLIVWAQGTLNQYWGKIKGVDLQEARIGVGEVIFVLIGLLFWGSIFIPE